MLSVKSSDTFRASRMARTKIICTLGPASACETVLRRMILSGMDIARINFSHGSTQERIGYVRLIRRLNKKYRRHIRLLGDLEGFRIRIGPLPGGRPIELVKRQSLLLTNAPGPGRVAAVPFDYKGALTDIRKGSLVFIDDGLICLQVLGHRRDGLACEVVVPGKLKEHKGVNIPGAHLRFSGFSHKDKEAVEFCLAQGFEYIAQSFVRGAKDMQELQNHCGGKGSAVALIAKIENREGIRNIDAIMQASDGIMIARGDMGVSLPLYEIPVIQKMIIRRANQKKKMVITATQMLESMTEHPRPTRAEVTDVANAILDGTDCLMLSAETAVGSYPAECVQMMNNIIRFTEAALAGGLVKR